MVSSNVRKDELKAMNTNLKAIGEEILEQERLCLESLGRSLGNANFGGKYAEQYYAEVGQNLWAGISKGNPLVTYPHFEEYGRGSGGELRDHGYGSADGLSRERQHR